MEAAHKLQYTCGTHLGGLWVIRSSCNYHASCFCTCRCFSMRARLNINRNIFYRYIHHHRRFQATEHICTLHRIFRAIILSCIHSFFFQVTCTQPKTNWMSMVGNERKSTQSRCIRKLGNSITCILQYSLFPSLCIAFVLFVLGLAQLVYRFSNDDDDDDPNPMNVARITDPMHNQQSWTHSRRKRLWNDTDRRVVLLPYAQLNHLVYVWSAWQCIRGTYARAPEYHSHVLCNGNQVFHFVCLFIAGIGCVVKRSLSRVRFHPNGPVCASVRSRLLVDLCMWMQTRTFLRFPQLPFQFHCIRMHTA